jgi:hypothetical protein
MLALFRLPYNTDASCGPLAGLRWSATTMMRAKSHAGDQAHMAASGRRRLLAKRAPHRITRAGWIFWGVVLAPVLLGIAVA